VATWSGTDVLRVVGGDGTVGVNSRVAGWGDARRRTVDGKQVRADALSKRRWVGRQEGGW